MLRVLLAALVAVFVTIPVTAQVVTSPTLLPDVHNDGLIRMDKMASKVTPTLKKGTTVIECSRVPPYTYAVQGTPCPVPMRSITSSAKVNGAVKLQDASNLIVTGAYRGIETYPTGTYKDLTVDNLHLLDLGREGVRLQGKVANLAFRHFRIEKNATLNTGKDLPEGFHVQNGNGLLLEDGYIGGMRMGACKYCNGDGIAIEKGVTNVTIRRVVSENHSDSAFDILKGSNIILDDVTGRKAARCVKTGAVNVVVTKITCVGVQTAIELHGNDITIDTLVYDPGARTAKGWLFSTEVGDAGQATLTVKRCMAPDGGPIKLPSKDSIWLGQGKGVIVNLGPTCKQPK